MPIPFGIFMHIIDLSVLDIVRDIISLDTLMKLLEISFRYPWCIYLPQLVKYIKGYDHICEPLINNSVDFAYKAWIQ